MGYFVESKNNNLKNLTPRRYLVKKIEGLEEDKKNYKKSILVANGLVAVCFSCMHAFLSFYNVNLMGYLLPLSLVVGSGYNLKERLNLLKTDLELDDLSLRVKLDDIICEDGIDVARTYLEVAKNKLKRLEGKDKNKGFVYLSLMIANVIVAILQSNCLLSGIHGILSLVFMDFSIAEFFESAKNEVLGSDVCTALDLDEIKRVRK